MRGELPSFSVIIPTYNRPQQLARCLSSFAYLDYPSSRFEVIVVDDGGNTPLEPIIRPWSEEFSVRLFRQANAGPAAARNYGATHAKGEYLAFTDDDCRPAPDWLRAFSAAFAHDPNLLVGGQTVNALSDNHYSTASQTILDVAYAYYNSEPTHSRFFASNNLAMPSHHFRAVDGFDPTFTTSEDRDFCDRWLHRGHRMLYVQDALVYHAHEMTLHGFWRQHAGYGHGAWRFHRARALRGSGPFRPDPEFYQSLLRRPMSKGLAIRSVRLLALVLFSQIANAAGFARGYVHRRHAAYRHATPRRAVSRPSPQ